MKSNLIAMLLLGISFATSAQNTQAVLFHDNDTANIISLDYFPNDSSRLIQFHRWFNNNTSEFEYSISEVAGGNTIPLSIPLVSEVTSVFYPVLGGVIFSGITSGAGNELIYFTGTTVQVIDLNPGISSSNPSIVQLDGITYIVAETAAGNKMLYHYGNQNVVLGISDPNEDVRYPTGKISNDYIYQLEPEYNATLNENTFQLRRAHWDGVNYVYSTIRSLTYNVSVFDDIFWEGKLNYSGNWFIIEKEIFNFSNSTASLLSYIPQSGSIGVVDSDASTSYTVMYHVFEHQGLLYWGKFEESVQRVSADGFQFNDDTQLFVSANDGLKYTKETANGDLWLIFVNNQTSFEKLYRYSNSTLSSVIDGKHLHFALENNDKLYVTDFFFGFETDQKIDIVNTTNASVEYVFVDSSHYHSPTDHAALIYNGKFTFLFENENNNDYSVDIYQLNEPLSVGSIAQTSFRIYPNPCSSTLYIEHTLINPTVELFNHTGQLVRQIDSFEGTSFDLSGLNAGSYLLKLTDEQNSFVERIIVGL